MNFNCISYLEFEVALHRDMSALRQANYVWLHIITDQAKPTSTNRLFHYSWIQQWLLPPKEMLSYSTSVPYKDVSSTGMAARFVLSTLRHQSVFLH